MRTTTATSIRARALALLTRKILAASCALMAGLAACIDEEGDEALDQSADDEPTAFRPGGVNLQSPYVGATYFSNWSEIRGEDVMHPVGDHSGDDDFRWTEVSYGYWSGSTWNETYPVSEIRVSDEGVLEINVGTVQSPNWTPPADGHGRYTRFYFKGDASDDIEKFHGYLHMVAVHGPTSVNSEDVYEYSVSGNMVMDSLPVPAGVGTPMCVDHGDGNQKVVILPDAHLHVTGANQAEMVATPGSTYFTTACSSTSVGKGRAELGVLPNSGTKNMGVSEYNSIIRASAAWFNGQANTTHGTPVYFVDLAHDPPWFGAGVGETSNYYVGNPSTWSGVRLESVYSKEGAGCFESYPDFPFDDCIEWSSGVHRSTFGRPVGWSDQSLCDPSPGSGGVAIYIDKQASDDMCET